MVSIDQRSSLGGGYYNSSSDAMARRLFLQSSSSTSSPFSLRVSSSPPPAPFQDTMVDGGNNKLYQRSLQYAALQKKKARKLRQVEDLTLAARRTRTMISQPSTTTISSGEEELLFLSPPETTRGEGLPSSPYIRTLYEYGRSVSPDPSELCMTRRRLEGLCQPTAGASPKLLQVAPQTDKALQENDDSSDHSICSNDSDDTTGATMSESYPKENLLPLQRSGCHVKTFIKPKRVSSSPIGQRSCGSETLQSNGDQKRILSVQHDLPCIRHKSAPKELLGSKAEKESRVRQDEFVVGPAASTPKDMSTTSKSSAGELYDNSSTIQSGSSHDDEQSTALAASTYSGTNSATDASTSSPHAIVNSCVVGPFLSTLNKILTGPCLAGGGPNDSSTYLDAAGGQDAFFNQRIPKCSVRDSTSSRHHQGRPCIPAREGDKPTADDTLLRTHEQLIRLRRELRSMKKPSKKDTKQLDKGGSSKDDAERGIGTKKTVRFAKRLVSKVHHRPYTREEDIHKLYFIEEELDGYEYDRATTTPEQIEIISKGNSYKGAAVEVEYKNKRRVSRDDQDDDDSMVPWGMPSDMQHNTSNILSAPRE